MSTKRQRPFGRGIAPPVAKEIEDDQAMPGGHQRDDVGPEMTRGGKAVQEDDRLADPPSARRVVIQPSTVEIDELTAHDVVGASGASWSAWTEPFAKMSSPRIRDKHRQMHRGLTTSMSSARGDHQWDEEPRQRLPGPPP